MNDDGVNAESPTASFDAAAIASSLVGTWHYAAPEELTGVAFLHFAPGGITLQFPPIPQPSGKRMVATLRYTVESSSTLRLCAQGDETGWTCGYRFDGPRLLLEPPNLSVTLHRTPTGKIPDWLQEILVERQLL